MTNTDQSDLSKVFRTADIQRFQQAIKGFDKSDFREVIFVSVIFESDTNHDMWNFSKFLKITLSIVSFADLLKIIIEPSGKKSTALIFSLTSGVGNKIRNGISQERSCLDFRVNF